MREWMKHFTTELRMSFRGPGLWMVCLVALALAWIVKLSSNGILHYQYILGQSSFLYLAPLSIFATIAGVHAAKRDQGVNIDKLIGSIAYTSAPMTSARIAAASLPYLILSFVPAALFTFDIINHATAAIGQLGYTYLFTLCVALGMVYIVTLGYVLGSLVRGRSAYFFGFVLWFVHCYGGLFIFNQMLPAPWFNVTNVLLFDYKMSGYFDDQWGLSGDLAFWLHRAIFASLTGLFGILVVWSLAKRRKEPIRTMRIALALIVSIALAGSSLLTYSSVLASRASAFQDLEDTVKKASQPAIDEATPGFRVLAYDIQLTGKEDAKLDLTAAMQVQTESSDVQKLVFTLKKAFQVDHAVVNGSRASFAQKGDIVTVDLPAATTEGETIDVTLVYSGQVEDWRIDRPFGNKENRLVQVHFANEDRLFLTGAYGWYPLPGIHRLQDWVETRFGNDQVVDVYPNVEPANYKLTVDYASGIPLFSNMTEKSSQQSGDRQKVTFEQQGATGITLLGGPLTALTVTEQGQRVTVIAGIYYDGGLVQDIAKTIANVYREVNEIIGANDAQNSLTVVPIDPSKSQAGQLGGALGMNGYTFSLKNGPAVLRTLDAILHETVRNDRSMEMQMFVNSVRKYLEQMVGEQPAPEFNSHASYKVFDQYMESHSQQETKQLLSDLYGFITEQTADMDNILNFMMNYRR